MRSLRTRLQSLIDYANATTEESAEDLTTAVKDLVDGYGKDVPEYTGEYNVTPATEEQCLPTKNKLMRDDITVREIPYYETSNDTGTTVYIGSKV